MEPSRVLRRITRLPDLKKNGSQPYRAFVPQLSSMGEAYDNEWHGVPCEFVMSTGRCGTNTMTGLWRLSEGLLANHEPNPVLLKSSHLGYMSGSDQVNDPDRWDQVVDVGRSELIWHAYRQGKIYVESNNRLTYLAPTLARFFPHSRFIFLHRDALEVIKSGLQRNWYQGHAWDWARITPREDDPYFDGWEHMTQVEKIAWNWQAINQFALEQISNMPSARVLEVKAARLFMGDLEVLNQIFAFTRVPTPPLKPMEKVIGQKLNASKSVQSSNAVTVRFSDDELQLIQDIAGDVAERLGYSIE